MASRPLSGRLDLALLLDERRDASEPAAHLDGRVSAVVGTHTHVPTADHRVLARGTAYVSDLGMTGPLDSVIGFQPETVLPRFMNGLPTRFQVGTGPVFFNAVLIDIDPATGRAHSIERISRIIEV